MNWDDYRYFLTLARTGSFSSAGRRLHVDHTTVARRISALESYLGVKLVERMAREVTLTDIGSRLAALGEPVEEAMASVERAAAGATTGLAGIVRISAPPSLAMVTLAPKLLDFRRHYPDIEIVLLGEKDFANLNRREADIALRLSRPQSPGLITRKLRDVPFFFYASHAYAIDEDHWEFIGYDESYNSLPQQAWLLAQLGSRRVIMRSSDAGSQAQAAASGLGVALLPDYLGDSDPRLKRLNSTLTPPSRELWMLVHDDIRRAPCVRAVMNFLSNIENVTAPRVL
ncbi:LysR family transcriptional regulator [Rhizobium sp.]|uniref:LysR family transcriptional regulator n=1 Tax=Rhizobium sp. TaxID=391 RepID=UPI002AA6C5B4